MRKKDGTAYYKASITYLGQHISLGSYPTEKKASLAYERAAEILFSGTESRSRTWTVESYRKYGKRLPFDKWVMLLNFRDNKMYCRNAIYLKKRYFIYYLDINTPMKFDADDLFYYRNHKIMRRGGHLFVADYGMQVNILSRYGIRNYAVPGKDYIFVNGDEFDYRYGNIEIINRYHGVRFSADKEVRQSTGISERKGRSRTGREPDSQPDGMEHLSLKKSIRMSIRKRKPYVAKIHVNGDMIIGRYATDTEAAIAYNKAADILEQRGLKKDFPRNYIENMEHEEYHDLYERVKISEAVRTFLIDSM